MTEQVISSPAATQEAPVVESSFSQTNADTDHSASQQTEKQISQTDVGKIAGAIRKESHDKGYQKGYQEALAKLQQQAANSPDTSVSAQQQPQQPIPNIQELVSRQIAETLRKEREESQRLSEEKRLNDYMTQLGAQLRPKIDAAKEKHEDFDSAIQKLHLDKIPHVLEWVNSVPNAGEVLYDLSKNPHKLAILNSMHAPELAISQIQEISRSLENNQAALEKKLPKEPLSTIQPSTVGKHGGELSGQEVVEAARKKYRF